MFKYFYNLLKRRASFKKLGVVLIILFVALAIKLSGLDQYLTLEGLKAYRQTLLEFYQNHRPLVIIIYFLGYVVTTALSIPGAVVMTLAGGALFGLGTGTLIVSFASTIGATIAFLTSRFLLRDWVHTRFGDKLDKVNKGIEETNELLVAMRRRPNIYGLDLKTISRNGQGRHNC